MTAAAIEDCKTAELHRLLAVQRHGALLAIDRETGRVAACSHNIEDFLTQAPAALLGQRAAAVLDRELFDPQQLDHDEPFGEAAYREGVSLGGFQVCVASHVTRAHLVLELEPCETAGPTYTFADRKAFLAALQRADTAEACAAVLLREVARLTDFDRVMLYRFLPDWHGEVIAEQNKPGVPGFLGLRFPAGDIPANARRLYTVNLERAVPDVAAEPSPIRLADGARPLDLSWSQLRAVHPVHLTYLGNIGAQASFSLSIVLQDKLWGMVACHHLADRRLSMRLRRICEELTRLTAMQMTSVTRIQVEREWHSYRAGIYEMRGSLRASMGGFPAIESHIGEIQQLFAASGIWQCFNGRDHRHGNTPDGQSLARLKAWVAELDRGRVTALDAVPERLADLQDLVRRASGMLFVPLNADDFLMLFRPEQIEEVNWAGRPADPEASISAAGELTPRTSFLTWAQSLRGHAKAWSPMEIESASLLRQELNEYLQRCQVERQAHADPLTGLANRLLFDQELVRTLEEAGQLGDGFAVLMIDLDKFKPVNDTLGHAAGDELLVQVAQRLATAARTEDTVARLGGDEFAVILRHVNSIAQAEEVAARMVQSIGRPFTVTGETVGISASIGVCFWSADEPLPAQDLLQRADLALYAAKHAGRNRYQRFAPALLESQRDEQDDQLAIQAGLGNGEFELRYQPIVATGSRELIALEAYCYWQHPDRGELSTPQFTHLMAHRRLMEDWTRWCLEQLFEHHGQRERAGAPPVQLSMNISAAQFMRLDLAAICEALARRYSTDLGWLSLDLDEQALSSSLERAAEKVRRVVQCGIRVNLDHFGRGAILLRQLADLRLHALKFSALEVLDTSDEAQIATRLALKRAISRALDAPMVATQVESQAAAEWALAEGVEFIEGYVVSRPLTAEQALDWRPDRPASDTVDPTAGIPG